MLTPSNWTERGYPDPYLPPELQRLVGNEGESQEDRRLVKLAVQFESDLPRSPRHHLTVPEDPQAILLAAARTYQRVARASNLSEGARSDIDMARYGMVRTLSALGMWAAKRQLEDAILEVELPERCERLGQRLRAFQATHRGFTDQVEGAIAKQLEGAGIEGVALTAWCSVDGASRRLQNLRLPNFEAARPPDFYDVYVLVDGPDECYRALQAVHRAGSPAPNGFQDLIVHPHPNGFSALTTRIKAKRLDSRGRTVDETVNVVIQTPLMHEIGWHGFAHPRCSEGAAEQPPFIAVLLDVAERQIGARPTITVYSQGGSLLLPTPHEVKTGATALDLAYKIHDAIGNEATSAVVNGKLVESLGHVLEEGAVVKVRRDPGGRNVRTEDDLDLVATTHARRSLKRGLSQQSSTMRGRLAILRQLEERGVSIRGRARLDQLVETVGDKFKGDLPDRSAKGIYRHVGTLLDSAEAADARTSSGKKLDDSITSGSVAAAAASEVVSVGTERLLPADTRSDQCRPVIAGTAAIGIDFAKLCRHCHPGPKDRIVGLRRRSDVTVHTESCRHAREREVLSMHWIRVEERVRSVINLAGVDRDGLVIDVCRKVGRFGCGLEQLTAKADHLGKARLTLHIYAHSSAAVSELVRDLGRVTGVVTVNEDSMQLAPAGDSGRRDDTEPQGLSRADTSPLGLHVRRNRELIRHDLINIPYNPQRPCFDGRFFGREDESEALIRSMKRHDDPFIFICGPRMIGKSSLALRFNDKLAEPDRPHVLRVDLRSYMAATSRQVFEKIVAEFRAMPFATRDVPDHEDPKDTLDALVDSCDRRLLLILDEFGGPLESFRDKQLGGQFFSWIRTAMEKQHRQLTLMMAGPPEAGDLLRGVANRDLGERLDTFPLRVLTPSAAREMFTEPLTDECISVRDGAAEKIVDHCGGHPYYLICLLQKVGQHLDADRRRWHVTRADIVKGVNALLKDHLPLSSWIAESAPALVSQMCLDSLTRVSAGRSQYVKVADIARHGNLEPGEVQSAMEQLHGYQVVERSPENPRAYRSAFPLLHAWIQRGGIRRDYFDKLDPYERRCLLALCEHTEPDAWVGSSKIAVAAGLSGERAGEAMSSLVGKNVLESRRGRARLTLPALRAWVEDERRREQAQAAR